MIEKYEFVGLDLWSLTLEDDPDSREHMAYKITIETDRGLITIRGCHDGGPDFTAEAEVKPSMVEEGL